MYFLRIVSVFPEDCQCICGCTVGRLKAPAVFIYCKPQGEITYTNYGS